MTCVGSQRHSKKKKKVIYCDPLAWPRSGYRPIVIDVDSRNPYAAVMLVGKIIHTQKYCLTVSFKLTERKYVTFLHPLLPPPVFEDRTFQCDASR
jgi:hypothetical protein